MQNLLQDLKELLKNEEKYLSDDNELLRNKLIEDGLKLDEKLLKIFLGNEKIKDHFFIKLDDIFVFDKDKFIRFVSSKEFLPNSYTAYKNKIGLAADDEYLKENKEVVLNWAYKDCVLEGGQTKDEQKRKEIFYNEILAPDEIDRLFEAKVLTNFKRINKDGEEKARHINDTDNLIIKGNNLLALHSLKKKFRNKVKLIYIDPPYNTGNDSFNYNDSFNHSTWLTFMKNRLEAARELLRDDGVIFVQCDDNEQAYLKVLMDEVFERKNFVGSFPRKSASNRAMAKEFSILHDYIIAFKKTNKCLLIGKEKNICSYRNPDNDINGEWTTSNPSMSNSKNIFEIKNPFTNQVDKPPIGRGWVFTETKMQEMIKEGIFIFKKEFKENQRGFFIKKYLKDIEKNSLVNSLELLDNQYLNQVATKNDIRLEFFNPKPEKLLHRIIDMTTKPNDLVLDFHLGSGTTAAVAHKMGRQYIGIEQMDYVETIAVERMKKVIAGEQGGISKAIGWQGGGEFVYLELKKWNEIFIEKLQEANTVDELLNIWRTMKEKATLSWKIEIDNFEANIEEFKKLTLDEQKDCLIKLLDKNQLYVNINEIDDIDYEISDEDKKLNEEFYR